EEAGRLAQAALEQMGRVDILVNNAGTNKPQAIDAITDQTWDEVLEINLSSVMALTRALVPQMKARRWGRIIHISSIMGFLSKEGRNVYSATKSALLGLARASALDLGPHGITVNCIAPGVTMTEATKKIVPEAFIDMLPAISAMKRKLEPEDLAGTAVFFASDDAALVTGQVLCVDGGSIMPA
ncbi:MAG: SDR family NAD(P)-dependent oxidoreductase, partial [Acidimicrobiia bacterium]